MRSNCYVEARHLHISTSNKKAAKIHPISNKGDTELNIRTSCILPLSWSWHCRSEEYEPAGKRARRERDRPTDSCSEIQSLRSTMLSLTREILPPTESVLRNLKRMLAVSVVFLKGDSFEEAGHGPRQDGWPPTDSAENGRLRLPGSFQYA